MRVTFVHAAPRGACMLCCCARVPCARAPSPTLNSALYSTTICRYQLLIAAVSFVLGLSGELLTVMREKRDTLRIQEQKNTAAVDPSSPTDPVAKDKVV